MNAPTLFTLDPPSLFVNDDTPRVRRTDPVTPHEAADSNNVPESHRQVMFYLRNFGNAAQFQVESWARLYVSPSRVRSAFSELEALGKVRRTDEFRQTPSGRRAQVWAVV